MKVAVLTLTRDRLDYTKHCFASLWENAGCDFDWYVVDNASTDGTWEWLNEHEDLNLVRFDENVGVCRSLNYLLDEAVDDAYDVVVRFDNDCEVLQPDTLKTVSELVIENDVILAPRVLGLRNPPATINQFPCKHPYDGDYIIDETATLGGIFMAIPGHAFRWFRYDVTAPTWTGDERICDWWRKQGGRCGYVQALEVNHYLTTNGQEKDKPEYFARSAAEGKPFV